MTLPENTFSFAFDLLWNMAVFPVMIFAVVSVAAVGLFSLLHFTK